MDDAALIARAVDGDLDAYGELVGRYQFDALRVAGAIAGPADADDAAQEAFVRAFPALSRFDRTKPFRPWLMTIVANTSKNHRRSSRRWERSGAVAATAPDASAGTRPPEEIVLARMQDDDLFAAVRRLPKGQRDVIACRYLMDLTEEETAMVLDVPRGTVKSRLARGLSRLARSMHRGDV